MSFSVIWSSLDRQGHARNDLCQLTVQEEYFLVFRVLDQLGKSVDRSRHN